MGQSNEYKNKYEQAKQMYLNGISLTQIGKQLHMDRGRLSNNLKKDGIEIINKQNMTKFNENYFDIIDSEHKAYWLGFLYADGAISSSKNTIELSLQASDSEHLKKFAIDLGFNEDKHIYIDDIRCRFQCTNKHLKERLIQLGCVPQKSLILKFPSFEQVPNKFLYDFLRGYIDGDGSVMMGKDHRGEYTKPRLSILGTKEFIEALLEKTGWKIMTIQHPSGAYSIEWYGKYVMDYLNSLYSNATIYLERKYQKYKTLYEINCRF